MLWTEVKCSWCPQDIKHLNGWIVLTDWPLEITNRTDLVLRRWAVVGLIEIALWLFMCKWCPRSTSSLPSTRPHYERVLSCLGVLCGFYFGTRSCKMGGLFSFDFLLQENICSVTSRQMKEWNCLTPAEENPLSMLRWMSLTYRVPFENVPFPVESRAFIIFIFF